MLWIMEVMETELSVIIMICMS